MQNGQCLGIPLFDHVYPFFSNGHLDQRMYLMSLTLLVTGLLPFAFEW
jgi:hypothetical protein